VADAEGELAGGHTIHWDDDGAAEHASEKSDDPFGTVVSPDDDAIAFGDGAGFEFACESASGMCDFGVGPAQGAVAAMMHVGDFAAALLEGVDEWDQ
jgi:hypothetical protein